MALADGAASALILRWLIPAGTVRGTTGTQGISIRHHVYPHLMNCREFRRKHDAYVDDTLSGVEFERMSHHCRLCEACAHLDTRVRRALLIARNVPQIHPSANFNTRLQARLELERSHRLESSAFNSDVLTERSQPLSLGVYTIIAAGVLIAAGLGGAITLSGTRDNAVRLAPVVATRPELDRQPLSAPTIIAAMPAGMPMWPAVFSVQEAPWHFASDAMSGEAIGH